MMKLKFFIFFVLIISLVVGCNESQHTDADSSGLHNINYSAENNVERDILVGNNDSQHTDGLDLYNEISNSEEIVAEQHQELNADGRAEFVERHSRDYVDYIISGPYTPADRDIDLRRIERFVFFYMVDWPFGYGLIIDRAIQGRVYYSIKSYPISLRLDDNEISAEFKEEDLNRLIRAIEESGLRDWDEHYQGEYFGDGDAWWEIGILFDDGTMLRRSGAGMDAAAYPPDGQFEMLTDFVKTLGAEIEARHNAEQEANP